MEVEDLGDSGCSVELGEVWCGEWGEFWVEDELEVGLGPELERMGPE